MIYLFDKDERLIKLIKKDAIKTALQKFALTTEKYVSDRLTVEMKALSKQEFDAVEYMAIQSIEDEHTFHYFYIAQKFSGNLTTLIGVQSGIEELRKSVVLDKRPHNTFARPIINELLAGTNWQARFVSETSQRSTNFYYISTFEALKKVCQVWNLEMQFFVEVNGNKIGGRYIDFKQKIGEATGKRVVYGHNALQILQEVERTNLFTALIGRGKGEEISAPTDENNTGSYGRRITFEDVVWEVKKGNPVDKPKGQKYVELPEMTKRYGIKNADGSMRAKVGFAVFEDEEDKNALIKRTYDELVNASRPQLTLKTSTVYLKGVKIGDTIRVVRHDKKLDYDTRIFEITFNRLNNESSDIKLGDRISESNEAKIQNIASQKVDELVSSGFNNIISKLPEFLPSADGFNNNWYGTEDPTVKHSGKVLINDIWFKPDPEHEGHKIMLRWTGEIWDEILRSYDKESLKKRISEEIANFDKSFQSVNERNKKKIDEILQSSGASNVLAQEAKRIGLDSITKLEEFKRQATSAQTALSGDLDVLKRTVTSEVNQASEYRRTTTEALSRMTGQMDGFATKSEVKQDIDGLTQTFAKMKVGGTNLLKGSKGPFMPDIKPADFDNNILYVENTSIYMERGQEYIISAKTDGNFTDNHDWSKESDNVVLWIMGKKLRPYQIVSDLNTGTTGTKIIWNKPTGIYHLRVNTYHKEATKSVWDVKIEKGNVATDWSPAPEDTEGIITEAKATFERTAQGLRTNLSAIQEYVNKDGQRQEALQRYTREESAKQATAVRELVSRDFVGKATYQEDVKGLERRFSAISTQTNNDIATKIAQYKQTVDGRFSDITSLIAGKANQTDFQRVRETAKLHERILGTTETGAPDKLSRLVMSSEIFQTEVGKYVTDDNNLIVNSMTMDKHTLVNATRNGVNVSVSDGVFTIKANGLTSYNFSGFTLPIYVKKIYRGETYTLGFKYRIREKVDTNFVFVVKNHKLNKALLSADMANANTPASDEWREFQRTFTVQEDFLFGEDTNYPFYIYLAKNGWIEFKEPILVRGSRTGTYKPSQFDDAYKQTKEAKDLAGNAQAKAIEVAEKARQAQQTAEATRTQVTQLAGSYAIKNLNSAGDLISGINLGADGRNRLIGKTFHITGETLIDNAVIKDGMIANVSANKVTAGTIDANTVNLINLNANNVTSGTFRGLTFEGGIVRGNNGNTVIDLNDNVTTYNGYAKIEFKSPGNSLEFNSGGRKAFLSPTIAQGTSYAAFAFGVNDRGDNDPNRDFVGLKIFNQPGVRKIDIIGDLTLTRYEEHGIKTTSLQKLFELINDNFKRLREYRVQNGEGSPGFWDVSI